MDFDTAMEVQIREQGILDELGWNNYGLYPVKLSCCQCPEDAVSVILRHVVPGKPTKNPRYVCAKHSAEYDGVF